MEGGLVSPLSVTEVSVSGLVHADGHAVQRAIFPLDMSNKGFFMELAFSYMYRDFPCSPWELGLGDAHWGWISHPQIVHVVIKPEQVSSQCEPISVSR